MTDLPSVSGAEDFKTILDRMGDGFFAVDSEWRITYANDRGREILRAAMSSDVLESVDQIDGIHFWDAIPDAVDTEFHERYHHAMEIQEPVSFDAYYPPLRMWVDVRAFPSETGLSVYLRDITDERKLERRQQESLHAIQRLYAVSSDRKLSFERKVDALLELGCEYLELPNGFLTHIDEETQRIDRSHAEHPALQSGASCPLDEAYCRRTIELDRLLTVVNAVEEGWDGDPAHDRFGLGSYIGGRVEVDGNLYGTLCFADTDARDEPFSDTQRTFVELLTRWVSYELERRRAQSQLERERDRLDQFASVVSHDLRNPLNTAKGRADMLADECDSEHLPPIRRSLSRMESLIEDLLTLARDGVPVEGMVEVDFGTLADEAWTTTETKDATIDIDIDELRIRADESRLRQLLENLFRNAVEHGGDSVTVTVGALPNGNGFYVEDDGPGIPESERERVFETGYTTTTEGTGFGLSIVTEIASAHGWDVTISDGKAGGARFEVSGVTAL
ncbi:ATP-binding protein [Halorubrum gandharaense]